MRNIYISQTVSSEQDLYENIIIESMKIYGQEVQYIPRTLVNEDTIFGEDAVSRFDRAYQIEMYLENLDNFDGEQEIFTKFGLEIRDRATLHVSRKRWNREIGQNVEYNRPREGDLIYLTLSDQIFEIMRVIDDRPFYQLSDLPTYRMEIELFEYNDEDFDTNIAGIDEIEKDYAYQYILTLTDSAYDSDVFPIGTNIRQSLANGVTMSGEIADWNNETNKLTVAHLGADDGKFHLFTTGTILDVDSASYTVTATTENNLIIKEQQNTSFETDSFLDFSEGNPFGEPT